MRMLSRHAAILVGLTLAVTVYLTVLLSLFDLMKLACKIVTNRKPPTRLRPPRSDPSLRFGWRSGRLPYSAFTVTFSAFGRIDSAARLRWLLDPLQPGAVTDMAVGFGQNFMRFFHYDQSLKQEKN
jgi:hypothetical protein